MAPFNLGLINLRPGDDGCDRVVETLEGQFRNAGLDVLIDDRDERPGAKFAAMDLIGLPWQVVVGPRGLKDGVIELKHRATGDRSELSPEAVVRRFAG